MDICVDVSCVVDEVDVADVGDVVLLSDSIDVSDVVLLLDPADVADVLLLSDSADVADVVLLLDSSIGVRASVGASSGCDTNGVVPVSGSNVGDGFGASTIFRTPDGGWIVSSSLADAPSVGRFVFGTAISGCADTVISPYKGSDTVAGRVGTVYSVTNDLPLSTATLNIVTTSVAVSVATSSLRWRFCFKSSCVTALVLRPPTTCESEVSARSLCRATSVTVVLERTSALR